MPSSTTPTAGEATRRTEGHGYGLILFASILRLVVGCFNVIQGIAAIANSHVWRRPSRARCASGSPMPPDGGMPS